MGLGKFLGPRLRKVEGMPDIRVQAGSVRHLESGSVAIMKNVVALPLASPRGASEPESTLASTRSMHPLRMQPPNWNELFSFKALGASPPPPAALEDQVEPPLSPLGEQTEPPSILLEEQTEADLKELVSTNLRPITPTSTPSEVSYGWKALNNCVGWGHHFRGFEVNDKVTFPLRPITHVEVTVTPPSPPLLSWVYGRTLVIPRVRIENTSPPPSPLSSVKPQFIKSDLVDGEFANRYRGSNGKGLPPRTYEQQLDLKTSQSTHIRLLKGNRIPEHAYLKVPQLCQLSKVPPQGPQLERPLTKDCCDARSKKEALGTQMATGQAPEIQITLAPTNTLPVCPKTPKTRISVGQVLELPTLEAPANTTARPRLIPSLLQLQTSSSDHLVRQQGPGDCPNQRPPGTKVELPIRRARRPRRGYDDDQCSRSGRGWAARHPQRAPTQHPDILHPPHRHAPPLQLAPLRSNDPTVAALARHQGLDVRRPRPQGGVSQGPSPVSGAAGERAGGRGRGAQRDGAHVGPPREQARPAVHGAGCDGYAGG